MEFLLQIIGFFIGGIAGVFIMRTLKTNQSNKENNKVLIEVNETSKKNTEMANQIIENLTKAAQRVEELEKQKNDKPKTDQELADWFNNRKPDNKH